jgi:shikimate dehydrogenase
MKTTQKTQLCGILLHPAGHTRSPAMHGAAYEALGLDAAYLAFDVPPAGLECALAGLRAIGARQLSISIPHKEAILPLLDEVGQNAREIGAVNTVVLREGRLLGSNTDWLGATTALETRGSLAGKSAVVLGAGGTARALVYGLRRRGADVSILNRTESRAQDLAREFDLAHAGPLDDLAKLEHDVLVNTTSVGLGSDESPVERAWLRRDSTVLDAVYSRCPHDLRQMDADPSGRRPARSLDRAHPRPRNPHSRHERDGSGLRRRRLSHAIDAAMGVYRSTVKR